MNAFMEREVPGGIQKIFLFENGYGASVVKSLYSDGGKNNLWELAVIKNYNKDTHDFDIDYSTPITSDVVGYLTEAEVCELLIKIKQL